MPDLHSSGPLCEVGRYARLADARERGLVMAAKELPHWIERDGSGWVLRVEERSRQAALSELEAFEQEQRARPAPAAAPPPEKLETLSLYVAGWVLATSFLVQNMAGARWMDRGEADSAAILVKGEWWRTVTALTLHGDVAHLAANLGSGLLFAAFVIPHLGTGLAWFAIVLSGALGNALNAWGYRGESHISIGASTAVFGALGLLVGAEFIARFASPETRSRWQLVLPLGAGLALLAYLGVGEEGRNIDIMAHLWGFIAGTVLGLLATALKVKQRVPRLGQRIAATLAVAIIGCAWWLAWR